MNCEQECRAIALCAGGLWQATRNRKSGDQATPKRSYCFAQARGVSRHSFSDGGSLGVGGLFKTKKLRLRVAYARWNDAEVLIQEINDQNPGEIGDRETERPGHDGGGHQMVPAGGGGHSGGGRRAADTGV